MDKNSEKKNILFVCIGINTGGIERALINILNIIDYSKYNVDLLLWNVNGDLYKFLNPSVNVIDGIKYRVKSMSELKKQFSLVECLRYLLFILFNYIGIPWKIFRKIKKNYDIAIAFSHYDYSPIFVLDKVCSLKKYLWFHNGKYIFSKKQHNINKKIYRKFDKVICVSEAVYDELKKFFPNNNNFVIRYNDIDKDSIIKQSLEFNPDFDKNKINIVTVGRLFQDKGIDIALACAKRLLAENYDFIWYFVGDGGMRKEYEEYIVSNNLNKNCILLGSKSNPYPYMKCANIYVQPSRIESFGLTVTEAMILNKFIIASSVKALEEQLKGYNNSILCDINADSMFISIKSTIDNYYH
ncbi:glycosyltransferase [Thomasclavelia cocleata]|uniref:glycosyltransferase n=1 Tax=Thomasclavelia cocleata TaxID=69824 RepID=UPI0025A9F253|nr:glycosyltransferase [Thomasclavelia cocleata]